MAISLFFTQFSYASADYEIARNPWTANQNAWITGGWTAFDYVATGTVTQADRIDLYACSNNALTPGEIISMGIYTRSGTSFNHIASSSLATAGNVQLCSVTSSSTVTFVFDSSLQWVSGVTIYFVLYSSNPTSDFRLQASVVGAPQWQLYASSSSALPLKKYSDSNPNYQGVTGILRATGIPPIVYNASSSNVSCSTFDFGCYISQSFAWAFYPDPTDIEQFQNLSLASSSPFGYIYDMDDALQSFMTGLNATTSSFKITLDMTTLGNTANVFDSVSTSSITVFDICWVNRAMGELPANSFRDTFLPMIVFMMWIGLGWLFYSVAHKIL